MYNNGSNNNPNRRNNNQRRNNNNRGGSGKPNNNNRSNGRTPRSYDDENITPQQKRHFMNKVETHTNRGKELRAAGDRVEAENEFQHAEHYTRMIKIADDQQAKYNERKSAERPQHSGAGEETSNQIQNEVTENQIAAEVNEGNHNEPQIEKPKRERGFNKPQRQERLARAKAAESADLVVDTHGNAHGVASMDSAIEDAVTEIAQLSFMQPIVP